MKHHSILNSSPVATFFFFLQSLPKGCLDCPITGLEMLMHNSSSWSPRQSAQCGDIARPLSESKLALPPLAPTVSHYQQPTSRLQGQTSATPPPTSSTPHTDTHTSTDLTGIPTSTYAKRCSLVLLHWHAISLIAPFPCL